MRSAIVTGATSFIGSALVSEMLKNGIECYAIVRHGSNNISVLPYDQPGLHIVWGNAAEPSEWINKIPTTDAFFHFAWDGVGATGRSNSEIQKRNVQMALRCLDEASNRGCKRFIFAGSQAEYGICDDIISEETPCHPVIEYGKSKLDFLKQASTLSMKRGIEYVHLRIFSVYGPGDHPWTLVSRCLDAFKKNESIELSSCIQKWNFLYVSDAAEAIFRFGDCPLDSNPVYNIAGEETKTLRVFVEIMQEMCGGGIPKYGMLENNQEQPHGINPDIRKMQKATQWKMKTSFKAGIRKMLGEW